MKILGLIFVSNFNAVIYLLMIVCMIMNGNLISLFYPISIFAYALFEEGRPSKRYWNIITIYSLATIIIKFVIQMYPLNDWITDKGNSASSVNDYLRSWRVGIQVIDQDTQPFLYYFLFEALIQLFVTFHMYQLMVFGLWDKREVDIENMQQAVTRITQAQKFIETLEQKEAGEGLPIVSDELPARAQDMDVPVVDKRAPR